MNGVQVSDEDLTEQIRAVITDCSFSGEGHRKVRAHLRREHQLCVGKNRVLRLMRKAGLLAPQRAGKRRRPRAIRSGILSSGIFGGFFIQVLQLQDQGLP